MTKIIEDVTEQTALERLKDPGYEIAYGSDIAFDGPSPERDAEADYIDVALGAGADKRTKATEPALE